MALSYVGSFTTGTVHAGTTITCTKPAGVASGDLLLMVGMGYTSGDTTSQPTGFSLIKDGANFSTLYARLADGSEGSSFSFGFGSNGDGSAICVAIRGTAASSSTAGWFDPSTFPSWFDPGTAAATIAVPSITLAGSTDWLLGFYGAIWATSQSVGLPSGFTSRVASFGTGTTNGQDVAAAFGDVQSIASGATGTKTGSCVSADRWGLIVGIIPGAGGGTSVSGTVATAALAAPAGSVTAGASVAGSVATIAFAAPAGSVSAGATVAGTVATIALAAPAGTPGLLISVPGTIATTAFAAPAGTVHAGASVAGVVATAALAAPAGNPVTSGGSVSVVGTWTADRAIVTSFSQAAPPSGSLDCPVSPGTGTWLIAYCSWTLPAGYLGCTMAVSDDVHGYWIPLGVPNGDSAATGFTRCSIWARPGGGPVNPAPVPGHVYVSPVGLPSPVYPTVIGVTVIEVNGMSPYAGTPVVVTSSSNSATTISANVATPAGTALMVAVAATDVAVWSSGPGSGWTAVTAVNVAGTAPAILHTSPAYRVAAASETASWTTGSTGDLSACSAAILVSVPAPAQPNPDWPYTQLQAGFGSGALTPPSTITWTDITGRFLAGKDASDSGGKQYELDQLQAGEITVTLSNNDAALTPGNTSSPFYPDVVADTPMRLLMTWEGLTYSVWSGFVERWPQQWDDAWYGVSEVTLTDCWSLLTAQLGPCQQEEILLDQPYAYWTCGDAAGSTAAGNSAPGNTNSLQVVMSKAGTLTAAYAFGVDSGLNPGDPSGTLWQQTGLTSADFGYGFCLYCADQNYPPMSAGITVMMWFNISGGGTQAAGVGEVLILFRGSNASLGPMFQVHLNSPAGANPGAMVFRTWDKVTGALTDTTVSTINWLTAGLTHVTLLINETDWQVLIDAGDFTGASGTCNCPVTLSWMTFLGDFDRFHSGGAINAECCHLVLFPRELTIDRISAIVIAGFPVIDLGQFGSEVPKLRIERLAGYGGWTGARSISSSSGLQLAGISDIQGSTGYVASDGVVTAAEGQASGEAITNIVVTDNGFMSVDGNGVLCYLSRIDLYGETPQWYLGELQGSPLNENWSLVGVVTPWAAFGGSATFTTSDVVFYFGYPGAVLTPDGSTADPGIESEFIAVQGGTSYLASAVVNCPAGFSGGFIMQIKWYNAAAGLISSSSSSVVALAAGVTVTATVTASAPSSAVSAVLTPFMDGTPTAAQYLYVILPMLQPSASGSPGASGIAGEYPYEPDATLGYDKSLLYNDVELTQSTGNGTPVVAQNLTSIAQHGDFLYSATVYQYQAAQVADEASWIVDTRGTVYNRAESIRVSAAGNPLSWRFVLGVQPAEIAQIARRPPGSQTVIQSIITQVARSIDFVAGTFDTTIQTDAFPEGTVLIADDPVRGQLTGTNILAW